MPPPLPPSCDGSEPSGGGPIAGRGPVSTARGAICACTGPESASRGSKRTAQCVTALHQRVECVSRHGELQRIRI